MTTEELVKNILLLPVDTYTRKNVSVKIECTENGPIITTGMRYIPSGSKSAGLDCDVSEIAIKFYETIYEWCPKILRHDRRPINDSFIGDTMITNHKENRYTHCLANFWLLPSDLGRTLKKYSKAQCSDRMEFFLMDLKNNYEFYKNLDKIYFSKFSSFADFCEKHYLDKAYFKNGELRSTFDETSMEEIVKIRAREIARRKYNELSCLFFEHLGIKRKGAEKWLSSSEEAS